MAIFVHLQGQLQEGVVPPCLFNVQGEHGAATYTPDTTFLRVCTSLSLVLMITAETSASRGQLRADTVVCLLHVWHRNLVYGLSWIQTRLLLLLSLLISSIWPLQLSMTNSVWQFRSHFNPCKCLFKPWRFNLVLFGHKRTIPYKLVLVQITV